MSRGAAYRLFPSPPARLPNLSDLPREPPALDAPPPAVEGSAGPVIGYGPVLPAQAADIPPPARPSASRSEPAQTASTPVRVSIGVQMAKLVKQVIPAYPPIAKAMRVSGTVHLLGVIGKDGRIENLQLLSGNPMLAQAAMEAVRQWIYKPTLLNGEPVEVTAPIDVNFALTQ